VQGISWLAEKLLACEEELCSTKLFNYLLFCGIYFSHHIVKISAAGSVYALVRRCPNVTTVLWHFKLIMRTVYVCVCFLFHLLKGICIAMLVIYFSVTSLFQIRIFISRHIIVSHYLPSIMQNNITLETLDTILAEICTGLFEMIVWVLTTCHIQYTWDRSTCFFI